MEEASSSRRSYLLEAEIRFRKKRVTDERYAEPIERASQVYDLFQDSGDEAKERLVIINLNSRNKVINLEVVAAGGDAVNGVYGRPMETFRTSFAVNAHGAIVVHNHPSGDPLPSEADKTFTAQLLRMSKDMGLALHDHIIIGRNTYFSFRGAGLLD